MRAPRSGHATRITAEGVIFILLAILLGMAAVNTGQNLLYLVFSVMLSMLLLSGIWARLNLRGLRPERRYPLTLHAEEAVEGLIVLRNRKRWSSSYALGLTDYAVDPQAVRLYPLRGFLPIATPHQPADCMIRLCFPHRGVYRLGPLELGSRFPFGMFRHFQRVDLPGEVLVFPRLLPLGVLAGLQGPPGDIETDRRGQGVNLFGIRDYQHGDPARFIHWKQSSKGQGIKLREFEEERTLAFRLVLDLRCPDPVPAETAEAFEKAVSVAASLAREMIQRGASIGLWTSAGHIPLGTGPRQLHRIMVALARVTLQPGGQQGAGAGPAGEGEATYVIEYRDEPPARRRGRTAADAITQYIDARRIPWPAPQAGAPPDDGNE